MTWCPTHGPTDTGTSHERRYNPVLSSSTALYTNNSMLDNVSSFDRITVVTRVCKLLYAVLTNTLSCHSSHRLAWSVDVIPPYFG